MRRSPIVRRRRYAAVMVAAGALFIAFSPSMASAQFDFGSQISKQLSDALNKAMTPPVVIIPAVTTIDVKNKSATFECINNAKDTIEVTFSLGGQGRGAAALGAMSANGSLRTVKGGRVLAEGEMPTKPDSIHEDTSLVQWIRELPQTLKLAPGEKRTITVKVEVPADAKPGMYTAWVIASMPTVKTAVKEGASSVTFTVKGAGKANGSKTDGPPKTITTSVQLRYHLVAAP